MKSFFLNFALRTGWTLHIPHTQDLKIGFAVQGVCFEEKIAHLTDDLVAQSGGSGSRSCGSRSPHL